MKAFTFVEFLVVTGVLFGLAVIFFPTSCRSRESARRSSCQSNLKQIALGIHQYVQDYDDRYPMWQQKLDPGRGWAAAIEPYLKTTQLFQCPSEKTGAEIEPASLNYCDYFFNSNLGPRTGGHRKEQLDNAAITIMMGDSVSYSSNNASNGGTVTAVGVDGTSGGPAVEQGQWKPCPTGSVESSRRHLDGSNYAFADGHVKWLLPTKVTRDSAANSLNLPTFRWSDRTPPLSGS